MENKSAAAIREFLRALAVATNRGRITWEITSGRDLYFTKIAIGKVYFGSFDRKMIDGVQYYFLLRLIDNDNKQVFSIELDEEDRDALRLFKIINEYFDTKDYGVIEPFLKEIQSLVS